MKAVMTPALFHVVSSSTWRIAKPTSHPIDFAATNPLLFVATYSLLDCDNLTQWPQK
jgi:hypothetical protein